MKKKEKRQPHSDSTISTLLGRDTVIEGTLTFKETIRVDGCIKGKIVSPSGVVIVGEKADVEADIQVAVAIVRGKVTGRIDAAERIEVYAPARLEGDISAPSIAIDSGVHFNGQCRMAPPSTATSAKVGKPLSSAAAKGSTPGNV